MRFAPALLAAVLFAPAAFAEDAPPSRTHVNDVTVTLSATAAGSVTYKTTVVVPTGKTTGRGRNARPQVKTEEKEETVDVIKDVLVKDSKGKEGKGDFSALAAGQTVKLHISKETVRPVGEKPQSKMVVTQIDVIYPKDKK